MRKKLSVLGVPHSLVINDKALEEYLEDTDYSASDIRGLYDDYDRRIFVREGMSKYQTALTILHEWLHAVGSVTGQVTLSYQSPKNDAFVDQIAGAILDLLKQKDFREYLLRLIDGAEADGELAQD